ncbi:hypothetical protein AVEN_124309-1, partial [Araneus ventricosus]
MSKLKSVEMMEIFSETNKRFVGSIALLIFPEKESASGAVHE